MLFSLLKGLFTALLLSTAPFGAYPYLNASVVQVSAPGCGITPRYAQQDLVQVLNNMSTLTSICSSGKAGVSFNWYGTTTIPCVGKNYNLSVYPCSSFAWSTALAAARSIAPTADRLVVITPFNCADGLYGVATTSCLSTDQNCYSMIFDGGSLAAGGEPSMVMHEMGHNWGIPHAGIVSFEDNTLIDEYGDPTDPMGGATGYVCYNAPNVYKLGWATPITQLSASSMVVGSPNRWVVSAGSFIRISNDVGGGLPIFISYRSQSQIGDGDLSIDQRLWIHEFAGVPDGRPSTLPYTRLKASVRAEGDAALDYTSWAEFANEMVYVLNRLASPPPSLRISLISRRADAALVEVCRMDAPFEMNCNDGIDNDCNGLVDTADPACWNPLPPVFPSLPPSPNPPFPPRPPKPPPPPRPPSPPPRSRPPPPRLDIDGDEMVELIM